MSSTLLQNTKTELRAAGLFDPDADYDGAVAVCVTALMETFVSYGQSGGSAHQVLALFEKLANHKPITPLTGEDNEWIDRSKESGYPLWQNNRYASVFKDKASAWVVADDKKVKYITFPYTVE